MTQTKLHGVEIVDGVHRLSQTGIKVVIAGGGVGGMLSGLECWRKGHDVQVIERNPALTSIGDFISIGPSALASLHYYPSMLAEYRKTAEKNPIWWLSHEGERLVCELPEWQRDDAVPHAAQELPIVSFIKTRTQIVNMLHGQMQRLGIPIFWGRKVETYEEDTLSGEAHVTTNTGEVFVGDVVIAADGVGTKAHGVVTGHPLPMIPSGFSIARAAWPVSMIDSNSVAVKALERSSSRPEAKVFSSKSGHFIMFLTDETVGIAYAHKDRPSDRAEVHHSTITHEELIELLPEHGVGMDPAVLDVIRQIPVHILDWRLTWRDPQPVWASKGGRIVQLGDSAHSFLPTSANGATQAMEDALSLAECLRQGGKARVPWATKVHEKLRYQRVSVIQKTGFVNAGGLHQEPDREAIARGENPFEAAFHMGRWIWAHNAETYAREQFQTALSHVQTGSAFENTNLPPGHVYEDWNVTSEMKKQAAGIPSQLKQNGDWRA